jgi:autotransporter-associated beta strand protein
VIQNVSGNNAWNGFIRIAGPGGSYHLASLDGTLTLGGNLFNNIANSTRPFVMLGGGDFLLTGSLKDNSADKISGLVQKGGGTTTLSGTNHSYSGPTNIEAGTVALAAGATLAKSTPVALLGGSFDVSAVSGFTLGAAQTLSGASNVVGDLASNGIVAPGTASTPEATISFDSSLTLNASSIYQVTVSADGLSNDKLAVAGALVADGTIHVTFNAPFVTVEGSLFDIADAASISGTPTVTGTLPGGLAWDTSEFPSSGVIKVVAAGSDAYATWASSKGLTGANDGAGMDPDDDGVSNLMEFVLGGEPNPANAGSNSTGLLPVATTTGGNLVFTFIRDAQSKVAGLALTIEVGTDLVTFPSIFTVGNETASSSAGVTVEPIGDDDLVTLTIARSPDTRKFARLNAVYTAP